VKAPRWFGDTRTLQIIGRVVYYVPIKPNHVPLLSEFWNRELWYISASIFQDGKLSAFKGIF
jgi:hypothetical protein